MVSALQVRELMRELWKKKLRTFLSVFGIFWGTVSVVMLLALGNGYYNQSVKSLTALTNGAVMFFVGTTQKSYQGYPAGRPVKITASSLMAMADQLPGIRYLSPSVSTGTAVISYQKKAISRAVSGVNWSYSLIWSLNKKIRGQFLSKESVRRAEFNVVIGEAIEKEVSPKESLIGRFIDIKGIPFRVVGVVVDQESGASGFLSQRIFIPYTTAITLVGDQNIQAFTLLPNHPSQSPRLKEVIRDYLGLKFHFNPTDTRALNSPDLAKMMRYISIVFTVIKSFLGFCGLLTLAVGAISVSNMMFLIVTERTHEIGLRKALGATNRDIASIVLVETALIVFIGGALGFILSFLLVEAFGVIPLPTWLGKPVINWGTIWVTWAVLFALTAFSALFPARRAMKMDPAEALSQ